MQRLGVSSIYAQSKVTLSGMEYTFIASVSGVSSQSGYR